MASVWLDEYESAVDLKSETRSLIQVSLSVQEQVDIVHFLFH